ncbi:MAG: TetR/AcrR family transcriptional regulator [Myxococcales bacterium]|nr:TetR/AcrR family transcriptional regulator [Myxococcales bacterium]
MPRRIDVRARKAPQQQRSQQMRADILEAAVRVLGREGPERFTTARVAQAAGVSVGSLYQYFPNKHAILYAVHERIVEDAWREVQAILDDGERAPREKLVAIARRFFTGEARDVAEFGAPLQEAERFFDAQPEHQALQEQIHARITRFVQGARPELDDAEARDRAAFLIVVLESVGKQVAAAGLPLAVVERWADDTATMLADHLGW